VHQHDRRCRQIGRALHPLAYIDRGVVNGSLLLHLVGDDLIALVEEQDTEVLMFASMCPSVKGKLDYVVLRLVAPSLAITRSTRRSWPTQLRPTAEHSCSDS
jgi:hypothetical protein